MKFYGASARLAALTCSIAALAQPSLAAGGDRACLARDKISSETVVSDGLIRFTTADGAVWENRLPSTCAGLASAGRFSPAESDDLLCEGDRISVAGSGCTLGSFSPAN